MIRNLLSKFLKPSQISKIYFIGVIALVFIAVIFIAEMRTSNNPRKKQEADVSNLVLNTNSRELGLEAVNQKATQTSKLQREQGRRLEALEAENKRLRQEASEAKRTAAKVDKLVQELEELKKQNTLTNQTMDSRLDEIANNPPVQVNNQQNDTLTPQRPDTVARLPVNPAKPTNSNTQFSYGGNNVTDDANVPYQPPVQTVAPVQDLRTEQLFMIIEDESYDSDNDSASIYLPRGSILTGVLLTGIDAPTQADAQNQPVPILVRLKKEAILPNYATIDEVRECFAIMAGYGELSSERAKFRGEGITCVREDGSVIEKDFGGYAVGEDGKAGIKGTLVSRNSTVLANTMMAGFASGLASMFNVNPVPVIATSNTGQQQYQDVFNSQAVQGGLAKGASQSMDKLADYYMKLADSIHPVIEVGAGRVIDIVITKGTEI